MLAEMSLLSNGLIVASIGAGVGEVVAWVIWGHEGHYWGGGIGALVGGVLGHLLGLADRRPPSLSLQSAAKNYNNAVGGVAFLLASAGVIGFALTGKWIGIVGAVFFFICGLYLLRRGTKKEDRLNT